MSCIMVEIYRSTIYFSPGDVKGFETAGPGLNLECATHEGTHSCDLLEKEENREYI